MHVTFDLQDFEGCRTPAPKPETGHRAS